MKKITLLSVICFLMFSVHGQTVIVMELPEQSEQYIEVNPLFVDALLKNVPTAIGLMGYDIFGGTPPYRYQWFENDKVLSTSESLLLRPESGNKYFLVVSDKNNCTVKVPIPIDENESAPKKSSIFDNVITNLTGSQLTLSFPEDIIDLLEFSISDVSGQKVISNRASVSSSYNIALTSGVYLLHLKAANEIDVRKYIIH